MSAAVAPLVGAWIEIASSCRCSILTPSLLSWERGLKFEHGQECILKEIVAPLVGAWIEITSLSSRITRSSSLLSWERGLKYIQEREATEQEQSLLSWERGLKYVHPVRLCSERGRSSRGSVD